MSMFDKDGCQLLLSNTTCESDSKKRKSPNGQSSDDEGLHSVDNREESLQNTIDTDRENNY